MLCVWYLVFGLSFCVLDGCVLMVVFWWLYFVGCILLVVFWLCFGCVWCLMFMCFVFVLFVDCIERARLG